MSPGDLGLKRHPIRIVQHAVAQFRRPPMNPGSLTPAERRDLTTAGLFKNVNPRLPPDPDLSMRVSFLSRYPKKRGRPVSDLHVRVLSVLKSATGPMTADRLADVVYASDLDGGPVTAGNLVRQAIGLLRSQGHRITTTKGNVGGYVYAGRQRYRGRVPA